MGLAAAPATAATANFQGNCSDIGTVVRCTFDAQRPAGSPSSCSPNSIWWYSWNFGDGTGSGLTTNPQVTHDYDESDDYFPQLIVICSNGSTPTKTRHLCINFGTPGCIAVGVGWN
jgi:hypothetical protein